MKIVIDAIGVRRGSAAIVIGNLLRGWVQHAPGDQILILTDGEPHFVAPASATVRSIMTGRSRWARLRAQSVGVRQACRHFAADAVLSAVTAGTFLGATCPSGAIVYDLRHELRPDQFSLRRRLARRVLYGWTFRRADALFCISERTRRDLLARRPGLAAKTHATLLGADHAAAWASASAAAGAAADAVRPYVLAFGHFPNKNLEAVLHAWALGAPAGDPILRVCGLGAQARATAVEQVAALGLGDRVELLGWLEDDEFESIFAGASTIVFPSDFEGFGLPVVESLLLGVPVVISTDPALLEVSAGHAFIAADDRPETLAGAIERALQSTPEHIAGGVAHARGYTWARMAAQVRLTLAEGSGR